MFHIISILILFTSFNSFAFESIKKSSFNVNVGNQIYLAVDLYMPSKSIKTKALIIVSPGSDGGGDIFLDGELKQKTYDPDHRGGLVNLFNSAGYAVAFFWQRGRLRTFDCVTGNDYEQRVKSYAAACHIKKIREKQDLDITTFDTEKVYEFLSKNVATKNLPIIALGISEGSYHVSKLIKLKRIQPIGVVFIGGMYDSIASTFGFQFRRDFYFNKIDLTFKKTNKDQVTFADVAKYGNLNIYLEQPNHPPWGIGLTMGDVVINKKTFEDRKLLFKNFYISLKEKYKKMSSSVPENAFYNGHEIQGVFSSNYLKQVFSAEEKIIDQISLYDKRVIFLYGSFESLVEIPSTNLCPQTTLKCQIDVIKGVGHVLENESGFPNEESLHRILNSVNIVSAKD